MSTCYKPLIALSHYLRGSPCSQPRLRKGHMPLYTLPGQREVWEGGDASMFKELLLLPFIFGPFVIWGKICLCVK